MLRADDIVSASADPTKIPGSRICCSCEHVWRYPFVYIFGRLSMLCADDIVSAFFQFTREAVGFPTICAKEIVSAYSTDTKEPAFHLVLAQDVIPYRDVLLFMLYRDRTEMRHGRFHWRQPLLHYKSKYGPDETSGAQLLPIL